MSRNVISSSRKSKTVWGGLNTIPYNDRNFLAILYFESQRQIKTVYTKEMTRKRTTIPSLALHLYPLFNSDVLLVFALRGSFFEIGYTGRDKRPTIHRFETKVSITSKLVVCNTYKQATQLTLTEGLVVVFCCCCFFFVFFSIWRFCCP